MGVCFLSLAHIKRIFQNIYHVFYIYRYKIQDWIHLCLSCIMKKYVNEDLNLLNIFFQWHCLIIKIVYILKWRTILLQDIKIKLFLFTMHLNYSLLDKLFDTINASQYLPILPLLLNIAISLFVLLCFVFVFLFFSFCFC